ncbi:O-antigen ligase [Alkalihalobacillus sp. AL-G]|uniref:O-antigen ligase family protein n=1 Tax=Alkalihalobacillus sp. AL-G TaxID=2926399 RepID=UPI00272AA77F|nr:O-antigen ligase family protein [Alkalihalobacillus sp. AL-G]WLD92989.1 O-antigen ligase family protein [Alkalihalobacillus sp. AL-G]
MERTLDFYKILALTAILLIIGLIFPNTILGLIITAIIGSLALFRTKEAIILLVFYFPIRPFLIEINPSLKGVGDLIILLALLKVFWMYRHNWKQLFKLNLFEWSFIAFCVIGAISSLLTGVQPVAIIFELRALVITYLLFYVIRRLDINKSDIKKFLWTTFWTAIILCLHGIVEKLSLRTLLMPQEWTEMPLSETNRIRIYGLIFNPNVLAIYLMFAFMGTMYLKKMINGRRMLWLVHSGLILMLGVFILTYSRGSWIAVIFGMITYYLVTKNKRVMLKTILMIAVSIVLVYIPVTTATHYIEQTDFGQNEGQRQSELRKRLGSTFNEDTLELSLNTGRLYYVKKGFQVFTDHPIIGTGFATFGDAATKSYSSPIYDDYNIDWNFYSDNQYIQVIAQTGTIGVVLFAMYLLGMLGYLWKNRKKSVLGPLMVTILISVYVCGVYYNIWENKVFTLYYFIFLGVFSNLIEIQNEENKDEGLTLN